MSAKPRCSRETLKDSRRDCHACIRLFFRMVRPVFLRAWIIRNILSHQKKHQGCREIRRHRTCYWNRERSDWRGHGTLELLFRKLAGDTVAALFPLHRSLLPDFLGAFSDVREYYE